MPIYDYDGTTYHEMGWMADWDGTANHKFGKIYDNDGTTDYVIYATEEVIIDTSANVTPNTWSAKSSNGNYSEVSCSYSATGGVRLNVTNNYGGATEQVQRDFAQFSKITIYVSALDIPNTWNKMTSPMDYNLSGSNPHLLHWQADS